MACEIANMAVSINNARLLSANRAKPNKFHEVVSLGGGVFEFARIELECGTSAVKRHPADCAARNGITGLRNNKLHLMNVLHGGAANG
jgi:hypothetical protein